MFTAFLIVLLEIEDKRSSSSLTKTVKKCEVCSLHQLGAVVPSFLFEREEEEETSARKLPSFELFLVLNQ